MDDRNRVYVGGIVRCNHLRSQIILTYLPRRLCMVTMEADMTQDRNALYSESSYSVFENYTGRLYNRS